jgi:hypothetical protein
VNILLGSVFTIAYNVSQISEGKALKNKNLILKINTIMKTKISNYRNCFALAYVLLAVVLFSSCDEKGIPTTKTTFTVEKIELNKKNTATYLLKPNEHGDLNVGSTWICDSINAFKVGDTLSFGYNR